MLYTFFKELLRKVLWLYFSPYMLGVEPLCNREKVRFANWKNGWISEQRADRWNAIFEGLLREAYKEYDTTLSCEEFCKDSRNFDLQRYSDLERKAERDMLTQLEPVYKAYLRKHFYRIYPLYWYSRVCQALASEHTLAVYAFWPFVVGLIWVATKVHITVSWG